MAKFLFIVPPLWGHINPTLSLGHALDSSGHTVAWASLIDFSELLPKEGTFYLLQDEDQTDSEEGKFYFEEVQRQGQHAFGIQSIQYLYEKVLLPLGRYMVKALPEAIERFQPDIIISDHQAFAGAICAYQRGIPYVTSITAPSAIKASLEFPKFLEWESAQVLSLQRESGLETSEPIICSQQLSLVFSSKMFLGEGNFPEHYKFVGPVIDDRPADTDFDWERFKSSKNPKVLVSIGTVFAVESKKDFFTKVIAALGDTSLTVVIVADPDLFPSWPENFIVQSRVPQLKILPYLQAVVCHAGHNTVCESIYHGLPLVVLPIAFDQSQVATRVAEIGCGIRLKFKRLKAEHLSTAVAKVLEDKSYRLASEAVRNSFHEAGGTATALNEIESLLKPA